MSAGKDSLKPHLEIVIGSAVYGSIGVFLSRVQDMPVTSVLFSRLFFGLFMISTYLLLSRKLSQLKPHNNKKFLLLLGFLNTITGTCYFSSIRYSGISVAVLLLYTAPVYVNLFAPSVLGEKSNTKGLLPLILAVAGILLIAHPGELLRNVDMSANFQKGILFGLISGLSFGTTIITIRYLRHDYTGITQTFWLTGISLLFLLPAALSTPAHLYLDNLNILVLFGFTITFAAIIYLRGVSGVKAQTGSILALVEPVSGIFFDIAVLKNPVFPSTLLGCAFILTAAYIVSRQEFA
ncbi:MAG: DMT family transporter [Methanosarcina sp.]